MSIMSTESCCGKGMMQLPGCCHTETEIHKVDIEGEQAVDFLQPVFPTFGFDSVFAFAGPSAGTLRRCRKPFPPIQTTSSRATSIPETSGFPHMICTC